jgi:sugar lactone lactonase YvrE
MMSSSTREVRTLLTGRAFVESPRWHEGRLWFSDWLTREIIAVNLQGISEVMFRLPSFPFSIDWLNGRRRCLMTVPEPGRCLPQERPHLEPVGHKRI